MRKKLSKIMGLLGYKINALTVDETFGVTLPGCASKKTQGSDGYFTENKFAKPSRPPNGQ